MKKACSILFMVLYLQALFPVGCQAKVNGDGALDSVRLKRCMSAVHEINATPLTKAYLVRNAEGSWTLNANNPKARRSAPYLDEFAVYKDTQENIRKIIYTNYDYGYKVLIGYYDTSGQLIRAVFNVRDDIESFWGYEWAEQGELFFSNRAYIKYDPDFVEMEDVRTFEEEIRAPSIETVYAYEGKMLHFGDHSLALFAHVNDIKSCYNISAFPAGCATVVFSYEVPSGKTVVGSNAVRIRDAAHVKSKVVETLYAGDDIAIIAQGKRETIAPWGEFYWYKVNYRNFERNSPASSGYIFGAFIEPVEKEIQH